MNVEVPGVSLGPVQFAEGTVNGHQGYWVLTLYVAVLVAALVPRQSGANLVEARDECPNDPTGARTLNRCQIHRPKLEAFGGA